MTLSMGREGSFILLPDGDKVFGGVLAYSAPSSVLRFRGSQVSLNELEVLIEVKEGDDRAAAARSFRKRLGDALGEQLHVRVHTVDKIPRDPSGKLRYFVPLDQDT